MDPINVCFFSVQGVPPGVINMVFGVGPKCGAALVQHPDVPIISFTGSTATGRYIMENSAPYFKKLSLEVTVWLNKTLYLLQCITWCKTHLCLLCSCP